MSADYNEYFARYIGLVDDKELLTAMEVNYNTFLENVEIISEEKSSFRYADDKWSIKELISHIIDTERIFAYRALRFSRNDKTELSGYDENHYASFCRADERSIADLIHEFDVTRQSTIALYKSFDKTMLDRNGSANGIEIGVTSIGYLIAGHCQHHINILNERYI